MNTPRSRRDFLGNVSRGTLLTTVGLAAARELGIASARASKAEEETGRLSFGSLESLVAAMQETPREQLLPRLVAELGRGRSLRDLTAAAALANARTFGGEDYIGFHTMMALSPAYHMAQELPPERRPLPVFKVLYRNTSRIQEQGGRTREVLRTVSDGAPAGPSNAEALRAAVRARDVTAAERMLAASARVSPGEALNEVLTAVHDHTEVHRVVLPYRAWDLLGLIGWEQAHTLLRQSVRYCVRAEASERPDSRPPLARFLEEHHLLDRAAGTRRAEDSWVESFSDTLFRSTPEQAAGAAAAALSEGFSPESIGESITLAANQLILRDHGRRPQEEVAGKPVGSVHGDSIGVHAGDSANAWRNLARVSNPRNRFSCLILGAYQVALDRVNRGGDFLSWAPLPVPYHLQQIVDKTPEGLRAELEEAIRGNLQARAGAIVHRYGELGHPPRPLFDVLLQYAVSEDGALHAEKFYRSSLEEFENARPVFRWRYAVALARVTASEYGRPAPGVAEARALLRV